MSQERSLQGKLEGAHPLAMSVTLALRNRDELQQLLAGLQDPASPDYHRFLTPKEFSDRFGPTDFAEVRNWLTSQGFQVTSTDVARRAIVFTGTAAEAERAFVTSIESFGGTAFANISDPQIPARFAGVIGHIHGLDNLSGTAPGLTASRIHPLAAVGEGPVDSDAVGAAPGVRVPGIQDILMGPSDFQTVYDEQPMISSGLMGSGCIGIIGASKFLPNAVAAFNARFKLGSSHITTVNVDSGNPGFNDAELEAELDLEWSHAAAPAAASRYYVGNDQTAEINSIADAIGAAVSENSCKVISISFGFCGASDSFYTDVLDPWFAQAAAQGQSVITITHDFGAAYLDFDLSTNQCVPGTTRAVSEMAADPNVTAIGGTSFHPALDRKGNFVELPGETVWSDAAGATGGGVSSLFSKPSFQNGPGVPNDGMRDVPDLALVASPFTPGAWAIVGSSCLKKGVCNGKGGISYAKIGGTSLSAPLFAGVVNLVGQITASSLGNLTPTIYGFANSDQKFRVFRDVILGNNSFDGIAGFSAAQDYDLATGWGSIDAANFAAAYADTLPGPTTVTLSPAQLNLKQARVGKTSKPQMVTIAVAAGETTWTRITSVNGDGRFQTTRVCDGKWIGPGKSCQFGVTFRAASSGPFPPGTVTVVDGAKNSPQTIPVTLTGK